MSVNSAMTAIADKIRTLLGISGTMGLDAMSTNLGTVQTNLNSAYTSVGNKGGTVPSSKTIGNLASAINSIPSGVELNYEVVGGTTTPANPKENTIWVNTSTTVTSYIFSATQPTGATGKVWISTGISSSVEFNALKENGIQVYPISAKQYVSGAWVDKTAKSYQGGEWVDWWNGELYDSGNEYTAFTGGWVLSGQGTKGASSFIVGSTADYMGSDYPLARTANTIDLSNYSTIIVHCPTIYSSTDDDAYLTLSVVDASGSVLAANTMDVGSTTYSNVNITLDIPNISQECYVVIAVGHDVNKSRVTYAQIDSVRCY